MGPNQTATVGPSQVAKSIRCSTQETLRSLVKCGVEAGFAISVGNFGRQAFVSLSLCQVPTHWLRVPRRTKVPLSASERQSGWVLRGSPMEKSVRWQATVGVQPHLLASYQFACRCARRDKMSSNSWSILMCSIPRLASILVIHDSIKFGETDRRDLIGGTPRCRSRISACLVGTNMIQSSSSSHPVTEFCARVRA